MKRYISMLFSETTRKDIVKAMSLIFETVGIYAKSFLGDTAPSLIAAAKLVWQIITKSKGESTSLHTTTSCEQNSASALIQAGRDVVVNYMPIQVNYFTPINPYVAGSAYPYARSNSGNPFFGKVIVRRRPKNPDDLLFQLLGINRSVSSISRSSSSNASSHTAAVCRPPRKPDLLFPLLTANRSVASISRNHQ